MNIEHDNLQFCPDCCIAAVNGDFSGLDYHYAPLQADRRMAEICEGLDRFGPALVPAFDHEHGDGHDEFSHAPCDCCGTGLAGARWRFATLVAPAAE